MTESLSTFEYDIAAHKIAESVSESVVTLEIGQSSVDIRARGAFIVGCDLKSPTANEAVNVLHADPDISRSKLASSHDGVPAGPYDGVGGQHGPFRWADYHEFPLDDIPVTHEHPYIERRVGLQAMRSDMGLTLSKEVLLSESTLTRRTTVYNSLPVLEETSIVSHDYFALAEGNMEGLTINGKSIDELLVDPERYLEKPEDYAGNGAQDHLLNHEDGTLFWDGFEGEAVIRFPAGHTIRFTATFDGETSYPLAMWLWRKKSDDGHTDTICFEPIVGVDRRGHNDGVTIQPYSGATLETKIEML